jgi:hypothetical protein
MNEGRKKKKDKKSMSSSLDHNHKSKSTSTKEWSANDARLHPQSEISSIQPNELNDDEEEEYIKHVQRRTEIHKRELKYELLLDLRSKLGK